MEQVLSVEMEAHHLDLVYVEGADNPCAEQRHQSVQMGRLCLPLEGLVIVGLPFVKIAHKDQDVRKVVDL